MISELFDKDQAYYHCIATGNIYQRDSDLLIVNIVSATHQNILPAELKDYNITSGLCNKCLTRLVNMEKLIMQILSEQLGVNRRDISLDSHLIKDLGADSLDLVELIMKIEELYGIEIPDDKAEQLYTPRRIVNYLRKEYQIQQ